MRALLLCVAGLAIAVASAHAAAPAEPIPGFTREAIVESGLPPRVPTALDSVPHPWPGIALLLSSAGTAAPILIASSVAKSEADAGLVFGILATEIITPSAGHLYAGLTQRAVVGMVWRGVGYGLFITGASMQGMLPGQTESDEFTAGVPVLILGTFVMAGSAVFDIVTVPGDVNRRNAEWLKQHAVTTGLRLNRDGDPQLTLSLRF